MKQYPLFEVGDVVKHVKQMRDSMTHFEGAGKLGIITRAQKLTTGYSDRPFEYREGQYGIIWLDTGRESCWYREDDLIYIRRARRGEMTQVLRDRDSREAVKNT